MLVLRCGIAPCDILGVVARTGAWSFRATPEQLAAIRQRAQVARLSMTEYILRCALGEIDSSDVELRIDRLEQRVSRLEEMAFRGD